MGRCEIDKLHAFHVEQKCRLCPASCTPICHKDSAVCIKTSPGSAGKQVIVSLLSWLDKIELYSIEVCTLRPQAAVPTEVLYIDFVGVV